MFNNSVKKELKENEQWVPLFPDVKKKSSDTGKSDSFNAFYNPDNQGKEQDTFISLINNTDDKNDDKNKDSDNKTPESLSEETKKQIEEEHAQINESVLTEIKSLKKEAYDKGYTEGVETGNKDGMEAGLKNAKRVVERIEITAKHVESAWEDIVKKYEKQILNLVCKVAEKVIYGKIELDKEEVKKSILHAFELVPEPDDVIINVNPDDYEYIEAIKEDFFDEIRELKKVSIISNPSINHGGCKIITGSGEVNSSVDSRLDAVKQSILKSFEQK